MSKNGSLNFQIQQCLDAKCHFGESKKAAVEKAYLSNPEGSKFQVRNDACRDKIFSHQTYNTYLRECCQFGKYCKENYGCKTIAECEKYVAEYLTKQISENKSASTIKTKASALGKLFGVPYTAFGVETPDRCRADIKNNRGEPSNHFSETKNIALAQFCRGTGLRRSELQKLKPDQLIWMKGRPYLRIKGKGGKVRTAPIVGPCADKIVKKIKSTPKGTPVWGRVNKAAPIHRYRSEYATTIYNSLARDLDKLKPSEKYYCRKELAGIVYDRKAMKYVSKALGHERITIIASNYLRGGDLYGLEN